MKNINKQTKKKKKKKKKKKNIKFLIQVCYIVKKFIFIEEFVGENQNLNEAFMSGFESYSSAFTHLQNKITNVSPSLNGAISLP